VFLFFRGRQKSPDPHSSALVSPPPHLPPSAPIPTRLPGSPLLPGLSRRVPSLVSGRGRGAGDRGEDREIWGEVGAIAGGGEGPGNGGREEGESGGWRGAVGVSPLRWLCGGRGGWRPLSPAAPLNPTSFSVRYVMDVGRDVFVADLRIKQCERFVFHLWYRKSVDCLHHVIDSHHTVERIGILAVWRGGRCFGCRQAVGVWESPS
jgi:hypothetical protein